jgi:hypothetical protein
VKGTEELLLARHLPVLGVFAEALALAAQNPGKLLFWTLPVVSVGLLGVGTVALVPYSPLAAFGVPLVFALIVATFASAFSIRVHRMVLNPGERPSPWSILLKERTTWRYVQGVLLVAAMGAVPALAVGFALSKIPEPGLPAPLGPILAVVLPYLSAQVVVAKRQLLYLTGISLSRSNAWVESTTMGAGFGGRLASVNLLSAVYTLGVSLFAGWLVGMVFTEGPQGLLEFLTIIVGLPAQLGCFACLQAACYRRLSLNPVP